MSEFDIKKEFKEKGHTPKLWDFYYKTPSGDSNNPIVSLYNKLTSPVDLDAINVENFKSQSEFTVPEGYKASCNLERTAKEAQVRWISLAKSLDIKVLEKEK